PLLHHVEVPQAGGVHVQPLGQLVDDGLQRIDALGRTVAPVGPGGLVVGVDYVVAKAVGLQVAGVEGDGLVARQAHRGGAVFAVGAGVGQGVQVDGPDAAVAAGAQPDADLHLMAGAARGLGLFPGVDQFGGAAGLQGDKGGVDLADGGLLGPEAAADAGLFHPDAALGDAQRPGQDAPDVEHDLRGGNDMEPPVAVQLGVGAEGLHHGLVEGLGVVGAVQHDVAAGQDGVHVAVPAGAAGDQVAAVVAPHRAGGVPVLLRVDQ